MQVAHPVGVGKQYAADAELLKREFIQADRIEPRQNQAIVERARPHGFASAAPCSIAIRKVQNLMQHVQRRPCEEERDQQSVLLDAKIHDSDGQQKSKRCIPPVPGPKTAIEKGVSDRGKEVWAAD